MNYKIIKTKQGEVLLRRSIGKDGEGFTAVEIECYSDKDEDDDCRGWHNEVIEFFWNKQLRTLLQISARFLLKNGLNFGIKNWI